MPSWFHTIQLALRYVPFPWENLVCYPKVSHSTKTILFSLEVLFSTTDAQGTSLTTPPSSIAPHHGALLSILFLPLSHHQKHMDQHCSRFQCISFRFDDLRLTSGHHLCPMLSETSTRFLGCLSSAFPDDCRYLVSRSEVFFSMMYANLKKTNYFHRRRPSLCTAI